MLQLAATLLKLPLYLVMLGCLVLNATCAVCCQAIDDFAEPAGARKR